MLYELMNPVRAAFLYQLVGSVVGESLQDIQQLDQEMEYQHPVFGETPVRPQAQETGVWIF